MDLQWRDGDSEARFGAYVEELSRVMGHADRVEPFRSYCTGLLLPGKRKNVEPMAARLRPDRTSAEHQSLLHFVGQSPWDEVALLRAVRAAVLPVLTARCGRGVDRGRYGLSEEGPALGRGGAAVLRATRQTGQLPGCGVFVGGDGVSKPSRGVAAVPAGGLGGR